LPTLAITIRWYERTSTVTVLFRDLNEARAVYQHALGGT